MLASRTLASLAAALLLGSAAFAQDPLADLSKVVTAVIDPGPAGKVMVVEEAHGASNLRTLAIGDEYRAGWKVDAVAANAVTLKKGPESRTIAVLGREAGPEKTEQTGPVAAFTPLPPIPTIERRPGPLDGLDDLIAEGERALAAMSPEEKAQINAMLAKEAEAYEARMPKTLEDAIAQGSPEAVSRLGGTMRDFMRASAAQAQANGAPAGMTEEQLARLPARMLDGPAPNLPPMPKSIEEAQDMMRQLQSGGIEGLMGLARPVRP